MSSYESLDLILGEGKLGLGQGRGTLGGFGFGACDGGCGLGLSREELDGFDRGEVRTMRVVEVEMRRGDGGGGRKGGESENYWKKQSSTRPNRLRSDLTRLGSSPGFFKP